MAHLVTTTATVHGRYLTSGNQSPRVLVGFHGYAESAEDQFERLVTIPGSSEWQLIAIQGLHPFYQRRTQRVVASWMTSQDRDLAIADNIVYVAKVLHEALNGRQPGSLVCAGFSQGVAMAFRAAVSLPYVSCHVAAVGGDVPPELSAASLRRLSSAVICRGAADPFYSREAFDLDVRRLTEAGMPVDGLVVSGEHAWSSDISEAVGQFLRRASNAFHDE